MWIVKKYNNNNNVKKSLIPKVWHNSLLFMFFDNLNQNKIVNLSITSRCGEAVHSYQNVAIWNRANIVTSIFLNITHGKLRPHL